MKGKGEEDLMHGVKQIRALADRLKREFEVHLPRRFKLEVQGILACAYGARIPNVLIEQVGKAGLPIIIVQASRCAELFPYISTRIDPKTRFDNKPRRPGNRSPVERLISESTLSRRIEDQLTDERGSLGLREGLHINFALSDQGDYAALIGREKTCAILVCSQTEQYLNDLRADIVANGLYDKFDVEPMPTSDDEGIGGHDATR